MDVPQDPIILVSFVNTKLRDQFATLEELCQTYELNHQSFVRHWIPLTTSMMKQPTSLSDTLGACHEHRKYNIKSFHNN